MYPLYQLHGAHDLHGRAGPLALQQGQQLEQQRYEGSGIPLIDTYYFILNGTQVEATKRGVDKYLGDSRADELKKFLKENKIKWKNPESLATLLKFLAQ